MADDLTQLQAATDYYYQSVDPVPQIYGDCVLLWKLWGSGKTSTDKFEQTIVQPQDFAESGEKIKQSLLYGKANRGGYGDATVIPSTGQDVVQAALFDWGAYFTSDSLTFKDKVKNAPGAAATRVDLAKTKVDNLMLSIQDMMGYGIYLSRSTMASTSPYSTHCDTATYYPYGLDDLFNSTSSTAFGGLTEDTYSWWAPNNETNSDTNWAFTLTALQTMKRSAACGSSRKQRPDIYIADESLVDGFSNQLQAQQRFSDQQMADAGFENVKFQGYTVTFDDKIPNATTCYAVNTNYLFLKTHPEYAFTKPVWEHPYNQPDATVVNIRWAGQLTTSRRNAHCKATNLVAA